MPVYALLRLTLPCCALPCPRLTVSLIAHAWLHQPSLASLNLTLCNLVLPCATVCYLVLPCATLCYLVPPCATLCQVYDRDSGGSGCHRPCATLCRTLCTSTENSWLAFGFSLLCWLRLANDTPTLCNLVLPCATLCHLVLPCATLCHLVLPCATLCYLVPACASLCQPP